MGGVGSVAGAGASATAADYCFSFGRVCVITCLPSFTSARKLMRSISPVSSQLASIKMPGSLSGVMVRPRSAAAIALGSSLPAYSAAALIM